MAQFHAGVETKQDASVLDGSGASKESQMNRASQEKQILRG